MTKTLCFLLLALGSGVGCINFPVFGEKQDSASQADVHKTARKSARVNPSDVTEKNAHKVYRDLEAEIDEDESDLSNTTKAH